MSDQLIGEYFCEVGKLSLEIIFSTMRTNNFHESVSKAVLGVSCGEYIWLEITKRLLSEDILSENFFGV